MPRSRGFRVFGEAGEHRAAFVRASDVAASLAKTLQSAEVFLNLNVAESRIMGANEKVNILMVDDQPSKLLSYEVILGELGENLIKARSGREALDYLLKTDVAVVLMDVSMPDLDGFELADMIRQHPRFQDIAIIFISAVHLTDLDRLRGYEQGAVDYISVPVVPELLRAKVSVFADLNRKTRQLETLNEELRRLSARLIAAQDDERRRIARELHDGLGQELAAAKMMVDGILRPGQTAERKESAALECSSMIDRAVRQVRSISHLLHPPLLDELGLQSALQFYVQGFTTRSGIATTMKSDPPEFPRLSAEMETAIFRVVQEALTNVLRHSGASKALVELTHAGTQVVLSVRDDGKGMSEKTIQFQAGSVGIGIGGIKQRIEEFNGRILLKNTDPGSLVEVMIPVSSSGS
jgi:signal transduction histidine kinase